MRPRARRASLVLCAAALFVATRVVLHLSGDPFFDPDSYKYLSGADSLLQGRGLPPLFTSVAVTGGALHVMPGYAWFIYPLWRITGGISLEAVVIAQSVISFLGFLALAHLFALWIGTGAAVFVFVVLCLSPSVAWLERMLMPDTMVAPLFMMAVWCAVLGAPARERPLRAAAGALGAGLLMSFEILMRTSSQVYTVFPPLLALQTRSDRGATVMWLLVYVLGLGVPLIPWMQHNQDVHGVFAIARSTGRNLYLSAAWGGTLDRARAQEELGLPVREGSRAAFAIADAAFGKAVEDTGSIAAADSELRARALDAYRSKDLSSLTAERLAIFSALFVPNSGVGVSLSPLRSQRDWYLANTTAGPEVRRRLEQRFDYAFSPQFVAAAERRGPRSESARRLYIGAIDYLTLDGLALLVLYAMSIVTIYWRSLSRWRILIAVAAPPAAFLVSYMFFGMPLYRYQTGLHPFMLAAVAAALVPLVGRVSRWRSGG
ncbi:MAG: hypothetical protein E4H03_01675 [Myxococcales bacterium]|nr:MAG: hypothetical protein E4H03_01675 [Myxococcales bacterium]